jgi:hypothetical protein
VSNQTSKLTQERIENSPYYQLLARGGHLLPRNPRPWKILFLMMYHGVISNGLFGAPGHSQLGFGISAANVPQG